MNFFKEHWQVIMIGFTGVLLGVFLNNLVRHYQNKKLLTRFTSELASLQAKISPSPDEEKLIQTLKTEIYMLQFQCN